jgi:hypothetical protein
MKDRNRKQNEPLFNSKDISERYKILTTNKDIKKIISYKCRFLPDDMEDIRGELICRILEDPDKLWNIYNISNELNKIISPILTSNKYKDIDADVFSTSKYYEIEYSDLNKIIPELRKILKNEEFLLFKFVYMECETLKDVQRTSKLSMNTIKYIHTNLKNKLKSFFSEEEYKNILK